MATRRGITEPFSPDEDGSRVISLGMGTGLHSFGGVDWETYAFRGAAEGCADDVCCHPDRPSAEQCALTFLIHGRFCSEQSAAVTSPKDSSSFIAEVKSRPAA